MPTDGARNSRSPISGSTNDGPGDDRVRAGAALLSWGAATAGQQPSRDASTRPNLSGYWAAAGAFRAAESPPGPLPQYCRSSPMPGRRSCRAGNFGGLKVKPAALAAAKKWKPQDEMTISRVCLPPSIVYPMQGPFPMEIDQATEMIVMRLEYYDLVRVIFMDGRRHLPASAPHTKVGDSVGRWTETRSSSTRRT